MVFGFQLTLTTIIVPFDFVSVENVFNTRTIGIIKELEAVQKNALGFEYQTRKGNSKTVFQGAGRKQVEGVARYNNRKSRDNGRYRCKCRWNER